MKYQVLEPLEARSCAEIVDLVVHMEQYQQEFPGSTIEMRYFLSHNDPCTVSWEIEDPERYVVMDRTSDGEFDSEGKIVTMCEFYEMLEPADPFLWPYLSDRW